MEGRNKRVIVEDIKYLGRIEVVILETDTKTYIADGYAMHNCQDVLLLEKIYMKMRPWMKNHPNMGIGLKESCTICGSGNVQKRGFSYSKTRKYQRLQCQECGSWAQGNIEK